MKTGFSLAVALLTVSCSSLAIPGRPQAENSPSRDNLVTNLTRPEEEAGFLRSRQAVITLRKSGELCPLFQASFFEEDETIVSIVIWEKDGALQSTEITSSECPALLNVNKKLSTLSLLLSVSYTLYFPSLIYEVWSTSRAEERYWLFSAPNPSAEGVSYWGDSEYETGDVLRVFEESFEEIRICLVEVTR